MAEGRKMQFDDILFSAFGVMPSATNLSGCSLYRGVAAPALLLTPTVGSCVVFGPKQRNTDAVIWEDKKTDLAYMRCAARHMLVGHVLRETDKQLVVRLDIPYYCLPSSLRSPWRQKRHGDKKGCQEENVGTRGNEEGKDDTGKGHGNNGDDNEEEVEMNASEMCKRTEGVREDDDERSSNPMHTTVPSDERVAEGDVCFYSKSACVVSGIVPVLTLTHEVVSIPTTCSRAKAGPSPSDLSVTEQSSRVNVGNVPLQRPMPSPHHSELVGTSTTSSAPVPGECPSDVLRVSLSLARCCCTSLLQSTLEEHKKLDSVVSALACYDFRSAVQHIKAVIGAQRASTTRRSEESIKYMNDSLRSSFLWFHSHDQTPDWDANRRADDFFQEQRCGLPSLELCRRKEDTTKRFEAQHAPNAGSKEDLRGIDTTVEQPGTEGTGEKNASPDNSQALRPWKYANAQRSIALLYSLLSLVHFHDKQYWESLMDAKMALLHDKTCIEAYTRAMASFMTLDSAQKAVHTAAVAVNRCIALSPQFVRLAQVAGVCFFYRQILGEHSVVNVLPRVRYICYLGDAGSGRDVSMLQKENRTASRSKTVHVREANTSVTTPATLLCVTPLSVRKLLPGSSPPMDYFSRNLRARAACRFDTNDVVFSEEVSLQVLLWTPGDFECDMTMTTTTTTTMYSSESDGDRMGTWMLCRSRFCAYCAHPLLSRQLLLMEVREKMSRAMTEHLCRHFCEKTPLPCSVGCGDYYCSEICRNRAALEYHSMECPLIVADEIEDETENCSRSCSSSLAQEGLQTRDNMLPFLLSSEEKRLVYPATPVPLVPTPLDRVGACPPINIRRSLYHNRPYGSLSLPDSSGETQYFGTRHNSETLSTSRKTADHEQRCSRLLEVSRSALHGIRVALKSHYGAVKTAMTEKAPNAMIVALLVVGRLVAGVLSLIFPTGLLTNEIFLQGGNNLIAPERGCQKRPAAIKSIVRRYVSRGFTSSGTSPCDRHDVHGLALAEEVLHQIRVPFFADTNVAQPTTVWELLGETPTETKEYKGSKETTCDASCAAAGTGETRSQSIRRGFDRVAELLGAIDEIVQSGLRDEAVAFSLTLGSNTGDNVDFEGSNSPKWMKNAASDFRMGSHGNRHGITERSPLIMDTDALSVWLVEEECELRSHAPYHLSVWTFGRLLGFLGKRRFMEQLWDFCLSSYCVVPKCALPTGAYDAVPEDRKKEWEQICQRHTALVAAMGPLSSVVTDLSVFGGDVCSRFFSDLIPHDARRPLRFLKNESPMASLLSINSLSHDLDETHSWAGSLGPGGGDERGSSPGGRSPPAATVNNVKVCGDDASTHSRARRVTMRARRPIALGEELRYGDKSS